MTILNKIIKHKEVEVSRDKSKVSIDELQASDLFSRKCFSLRDSILDDSKNGIIAEYKRASPSKGIINDKSSVKETVLGYQKAGASAVSVLTDTEFFKGTLADLKEAREALDLPLLRKDFVVDPYQIIEAKSYGADIVLLIAACLEPNEVLRLSEVAKELGLNVLLEVHNLKELEANLFDSIDAVGVNNRNLKDFTVDLNHSYDLVSQIPDRYIKISESGISDPKTINQLKTAGFQGFLIGENFMSQDDPALAIKEFVEHIN